MAKYVSVAILIFLFMFCLPLAAQEQQPDEDPLVFKLMVIGASDEVFIWWGHAALIVENTHDNSKIVYDWGIFSYPSDNFLMEWIKDNVRYKSARSYAMRNINDYIKEDRDISLYVLNLEADKKQAMLDYANHNVLPENCWYIYHPFNNNCATSIRDLIDMGTGGQLKESLSNTPGRFTYRQHLRRFFWFRTAADGFFSFLMGQDLDKDISAWDEMFLPIEIGRNVSLYKYIDSAGNERPLVSSIETVNVSKNRPPVLNESLNQWSLAVFLSLLISILLLGIIFLRKKNPFLGRITWGFVQSFFGLSFGLAGTVLFFVMFFMKHEYFRNNFNLLYVNPLFLAALPLGIRFMMGYNKAEKFFRLLWSYVFIADTVLLLMRLSPFYFQQNLILQIMMLPLSFLLSWNFDANTAEIYQYIRRLKLKKA
jgi:hypothetical protein